jgi:hypothetical protein
MYGLSDRYSRPWFKIQDVEHYDHSTKRWFALVQIESWTDEANYETWKVSWQLFPVHESKREASVRTKLSKNRETSQTDSSFDLLSPESPRSAERNGRRFAPRYVGYFGWLFDAKRFHIANNLCVIDNGEKHMKWKMALKIIYWAGKYFSCIWWKENNDSTLHMLLSLTINFE